MTCQAKIVASYLIIKGQKLQSLLRCLKCTFFEIFNLISINTARFKYIIIHLNDMKIKDLIFERRPLPSQVSPIGKKQKSLRKIFIENDGNVTRKKAVEIVRDVSSTSELRKLSKCTIVILC